MLVSKLVMDCLVVVVVVVVVVVRVARSSAMDRSDT